MNIDDFNLDDLSKTGAECNIHHPVTFETTDIKIVLFGRGSKVFKLAKREANKLALKDEIVDDGYFLHFLLASVIKSWENVEDDKGEIELTVENAIKLFERCPFIYEQVETFFDDNSNFFLPKDKKEI